MQIDLKRTLNSLGTANRWLFCRHSAVTLHDLKSLILSAGEALFR